MIIYNIKTSKYHQHIFEVEINLDNAENNQEFMLPNWIEGSYKIRDFAGNIIEIAANCEIKQISKNRFLCDNASENITLNYEVYAFEKSVRTAYLDENLGFFNPSNLLLLPINKGDDNINLIINSDFGITTNLSKNSNNTFSAKNYKELIDCPFMFSKKPTTFDFKVVNIPHFITFNQTPKTNENKLINDLEQICSHHYNFFDKFFPQNNYQFLTILTSNDYGGLEHKNSCALICGEKNLINNKLNDNYIKFLSLCSHEYFHTWWVKTLKPKSFFNLDLEKENYTTLLWVFEGITSYYDDLSLLRTKLIKLADYLKILTSNINRYYQNSGRNKQSLANASLTAWSKLYNPNEASVNNNANYYNQGGLFSLMLDIKIRKLTDNNKSLDDFVLHLFNKFKDDGLGEDDFLNELNLWSNNNFDDFFADYVFGTKDFPLKESLEYLGIELIENKPKISLGGLIENNTIKIVYENSCLEQAGIYAEDKIISIDKIDYNNFEINNYNPGDEVEIIIMRDNKIITKNLIFKNNPYKIIKLITEDNNNQNLWENGFTNAKN